MFQYQKSNSLFLAVFFLFFGGCQHSSSQQNNKESNLSLEVSESEIYNIKYYKSPRRTWEPESVERYKFSYLLEDNKNTLYSIEGLKYEWGYEYKILGNLCKCEEYSDDLELNSIISKTKVFEPFQLSFQTKTKIVDFNKVIEPLIKKISETKYLVYNELEFEVYHQDLIEELDSKLENSYLVTLTFDFEENGTIFLQRIEED
jgi:hypothetical protein